VPPSVPFEQTSPWLLMAAPEIMGNTARLPNGCAGAVPGLLEIAKTPTVLPVLGGPIRSQWLP